MNRRKSSRAVPVSSSMDRETISCTGARPAAATSGTRASEKTARRGACSEPNRSEAKSCQGPVAPPSSACAARTDCSRTTPVSTVPRTTGRPRSSFSTAASTPPTTPTPVLTPQSEWKTTETGKVGALIR